jgi:hypothetical protein
MTRVRCSNMIRTKTTHSDAILHATAIARWDDEGGASTSARNKTGVKAVNARSKQTEIPAALKVDKVDSGSRQGRKNSGMFGSGRFC